MTKLKQWVHRLLKCSSGNQREPGTDFNERGFQGDVRVSGQKLMIIRVSRAVTVCREDVLSGFLLESAE